MALCDADGKLGALRYFERLGRTLEVLLAISRWEVSGQPLPAEAKQWLGLVVELRPYGGTGGPPSFTGWWFDLFRLRQEGLSPATLLADTFTSSHEGKVLYLGALPPRLGLFAVDAGGPPRIMVGPVARAFTHVGSIAERLTDADAARIGAGRRSDTSPWEASYTVSAPSSPPLELRGAYPPDNGEKPPLAIAFELRSSKPLGAVTVEALDHHRVSYGARTAAVATGWTKFSVPYEMAPGDAIDGIRIRAAGALIELPRAHQPWTDDRPMPVHETFGGMNPAAR